jgi:hypothetical protein
LGLFGKNKEQMPMKPKQPDGPQDQGVDVDIGADAGGNL